VENPNRGKKGHTQLGALLAGEFTMRRQQIGAAIEGNIIRGTLANPR
jgi:hypothetical protein